MSARQKIAAVFIVAIAIVLRVLWLDFKPAHFDEGVNGHFIDQMRTQGCYRYDPANYHGPLHFYALFAGQQLFGRSLWVLRMPTALIGAATVAVMLAFRRFLPWRTVWMASIAAAISPAMTFFSRYAIHEAWLPFFTLLAVYGGFGLATGERRKADLWALGSGLTGMVLSKETYIIHWLAALLALGAARVLEWLAPLSARRRPRPIDLFEGGKPYEWESDRFEAQSGKVDNGNPDDRGLRNTYRDRDAVCVIATCAGVIVLFYSGFFLNWPGLTGLFETFAAMTEKGTTSEEGHHKEFFYWIKLVAWYEWPAAVGMLAAPVCALRRSPVLATLILAAGALLAANGLGSLRGMPDREKHADFLAPNLGFDAATSLGILFVAIGFCCFVASPKPNPAIRWLCLYGLGSLTAYSLIPYKTPWCIINILWPFFFVIGHLGETLAGLADRRLVYFVCGLLGWTPLVDTWRLNFRRPTKDGNRYVYVQTTFDIDKLLHPVRELIRANPLHRQMRGTVMIDAFPLIWEMNDLPNIIYLDPGGVIGNFEADFLLVPDEREQEVDEHLLGIYFKERFRLRAGAADAWLYLNAERFQPVLPNHTPEFRPRVRQAAPFHKPAGDMP